MFHASALSLMIKISQTAREHLVGYFVKIVFILCLIKWDGNHGATNARLDKPNGGGRTGAWSAKTNDGNQWIQVTFSKATKVTAVGIQGRYDLDQWVTKFRVSYSVDGTNFILQDKVSLYIAQD